MWLLTSIIQRGKKTGVVSLRAPAPARKIFSAPLLYKIIKILIF